MDGLFLPTKKKSWKKSANWSLKKTAIIVIRIFVATNFYAASLKSSLAKTTTEVAPSPKMSEPIIEDNIFNNILLSSTRHIINIFTNNSQV